MICTADAHQLRLHKTASVCHKKASASICARAVPGGAAGCAVVVGSSDGCVGRLRQS